MNADNFFLDTDLHGMDTDSTLSFPRRRESNRNHGARITDHRPPHGATEDTEDAEELNPKHSKLAPPLPSPKTPAIFLHFSLASPPTAAIIITSDAAVANLRRMSSEPEEGETDAVAP